MFFFREVALMTMSRCAGAARVFFAAMALAVLAVLPARAESVRIAQQYGVSYLPLTLMQKDGLLEKRAKEAGLDLKVEWLRFTGGTPMNEALISDNLDIAAAGVAPVVTIWSKTARNLKVKGLAALNSMPMKLVTIDPAVTSIADFKDSDRIALPSVRSSIQAITLEMAAAKAFGDDKADRLDALTVSMAHPDALSSMMSGKSEVKAHFGGSPYQEMELADPRAHQVLDSYDVLGGPHTFNLVYASSRWVDDNPKVVAVFMAALNDAMAAIKADPGAAADAAIAADHLQMKREDVVAIITDPKVEWTIVPKKTADYASFMAKIGLIKQAPDSWRDMFFPTVADQPGS